MTAVLAGVLAFVAMEGVSYSAHRWLMHGVGMTWHRSHHAPPTGERFERNDLFPLCFSAVGVLLFAVATIRDSSTVWAVAAGITAYGAIYLAVHELYIHRRLPIRIPANAYLDWLRDSHRDHHRTGAEPYGMLLPIVRSVGSTGDLRADPLDRRPTTRRARARL